MADTDKKPRSRKSLGFLIILPLALAWILLLIFVTIPFRTMPALFGLGQLTETEQYYTFDDAAAKKRLANVTEDSLDNALKNIRTEEAYERLAECAPQGLEPGEWVFIFIDCHVLGRR